ncbi:heat shock protein HtpX [Streptococcus pneumoniae]|nr:heat shock protein HtpX [Streptococcus pneumoniae]
MLFDQIASNKRKTWILLLVFFLLLALVGYAVGYLFIRSGLGGLVIALVIALIIGFIYALSMIFQSTEIVMSMNGAREVDEQTAPDLYHVVEDMALVAQIPMPRVFIIDDPALNAFATGSNPQNAAVAATSGLLAIMNREELEAVMGHEVSHIRNYDIRISTIAVALVSAITMLSGMAGRMMWWGGAGRRRSDDDRDGNGLEIIMLVVSLLAIVLAPLAATLVQLAISRQREFLADASSVELTRNPQGMINALDKLDNSKPMSRHVDDASSALYINDPKKGGGFQKLFYTHPPISERIERLKQM